MKFISRSEEFMLIAIWKLQENAYGVTIREQLKEMTGQTWAFGALFVMLDRLTKRGLLDSQLSDPTPQRGGRSKRIYRLTKDGLEALKEVKKVQEDVWSGIPDLLYSKN